jgi:membrane protein implicated in regulation of membrane protease activity
VSFFGYDVLGLIGLIIIGLVIILVIKFLIVLIPAAIIAVVVWLFTGNLWYAGAAFALIALLSIVKKL